MGSRRTRKNRILAGAAAAVVLTATLAVGNAYGRLIDWTSTEIVYTPSHGPGYSSDLLIAGGQRIVLADWHPEETERVVTIALSRPQTAWDPSEVEVSLDDTARKHLSCEAVVDETSIQVLLKRSADGPGLSQTTELTLDIAWQGLEGTLCVHMQPYGEQADQETPEDTTPRPEVVTGLVPVRVNDTINGENPVTCVKLNLQTLSDFTLTFTQNTQALRRVRWSMDGENYSLLYDSHTLTLSWPYADGWDGTLFLDFSHELEPGQRPTIAVEAQGYSREEFKPVLLDLPTLSQQVLKAVDFPQTMAIDTRWGAAQMQMKQIQRLTKDANGTLTYEDDTALTATVTGNGILLEPSQEGAYPASGSYRMIVQWIWADTPVEEQILYFFINTN